MSLAGLALAVAMLGWGCQQRTQQRTERGLIVDLELRDIARANWIRLRTEDGRELRLLVADSVTFSAGHLREHMLFAEPVSVTYRDTPEGPVAVQIEDG